MSGAKCCIASCGKPAAGQCSWRMSTVGADGERMFTGKTCGMLLCGDHTKLVRLRPLCLWHSVRAKEMLDGAE